MQVPYQKFLREQKAAVVEGTLMNHFSYKHILMQTYFKMQARVSTHLNEVLFPKRKVTFSYTGLSGMGR
jgi:hypothetical protein